MYQQLNIIKLSMQELKDISKNISPSPQCTQGNPAKYLCSSKGCSHNGFICIAEQCKCQPIHQDCHALQLKFIMKQLLRHVQQIPKQALNYLQSIQSFINQMIDKLSSIKQELQLQKQYFGFQPSQKKFLGLLNANKVSQINGDLGYELEQSKKKELKQKKLTYIYKKQNIQKIWPQVKKRFNQLCQNFCDQFLEQKPQPVGISSLIVDKSQDWNMMNKWLFQTMNMNVSRYKLLYRASQNQFLALKFHQKCDNIKNTIVIIKTQFDKIIGGFNPYTWNQNIGCKNDTQGKVFIFSLSLKQKFPCISPQKSIYLDSSHGPMFGSNTDIQILDKGNLKPGYSYFPYCYNFNGKYSRNQQSTNDFIGPSDDKKFTVKQYEVYEVKFRA